MKLLSVIAGDCLVKALAIIFIIESSEKVAGELFPACFSDNFLERK